MVRKKIEKSTDDNGNGNDDNGNGEVEKVAEGAYMTGKEVEERLLEAGSEDELNEIRKVLRAEGVPVGTISATVTRLRKKGKLIFQVAVAEVSAGREGRPMPVEMIIKSAKLPTLANGQREVFDSGVEYGMKMIVAGVRLAQELSTMGVAQASPVIKMAKEMRLAEGMSAQEAGRVAAEDVAGQVLAYLAEKKQEKVDIATVQNPLQGIVARAMEPMIANMFSRMFGLPMAQPTQPGGQSQPNLSLPPGWTVGGEGEQQQQGK